MFIYDTVEGEIRREEDQENHEIERFLKIKTLFRRL
jgi:hypothetical protein